MNNSINIVTITSCLLQINDKEVSKKAKRQEYNQRPEVKARKQECNKRRYQANKEKIQKYKEIFEVQTRRQKLQQRLEVKIKQKKYNERPEVKTRKWEYSQRPEVKARKRECNKKRYQANKEKIQKYQQTFEIKSQNESIKRKEQNKIINQIDNKQMINKPLTNLEVDQVNSECLQFSNDIYDQQTITEVLNALEPEQIILLNQSLDQLLNCKNYQSKIINNKFS